MHHKGTCALETSRLVLRRFEEADAQAAFENWLSDLEAARYMRWDAYQTVEQGRAFLREVEKSYQREDFYHWAITQKRENQVIGAIGLLVHEYDSVAEVSYCLGRAFWGRGIAAEALRSVLSFAMLDVGLNRVEAYHSVNNPASGRVMKKAGMCLEGHSRQKYRSHQGFEDCDLYGMIREDLLICKE
ncbi:MAG: GNAT family N-acetyltransferase [Clostridiales bacterium]|nr:GNAT family N-acetyltransferase [Clostridiales bacterium]